MCAGVFPNTLVDMWRMVWQVGARVIVITTNLKEGDKVLAFELVDHQLQSDCLPTLFLSINCADLSDHIEDM